MTSAVRLLYLSLLFAAEVSTLSPTFGSRGASLGLASAFPLSAPTAMASSGLVSSTILSAPFSAASTLAAAPSSVFSCSSNWLPRAVEGVVDGAVEVEACGAQGVRDRHRGARTGPGDFVQVQGLAVFGRVVPRAALAVAIAGAFVPGLGTPAADRMSKPSARRRAAAGRLARMPTASNACLVAGQTGVGCFGGNVGDTDPGSEAPGGAGAAAG